jgi:2-polyprenyl-3-methyl-5-hydroxy-6-metoxy-1,4-benzoquinol methylase
MPDYTEAEIQLLIALLELAQPIETPNNNHYRFYPQTLDDAATYFRGLVADWTPAYASLAARGLLAVPREHPGDAWKLTSAGIAAATSLRAARPPIFYWYQEYYAAAPHSRAYAKFCEALYGRALCQTNFSDMAQIDALLATTRLGPAHRGLDLGCGAGLITEYLSDATAAHFTGLDYSPVAIAEAQRRTGAKRDRLCFQVGNLDDLPFPSRSFDALISIDTLYMPNDLDATLAQMVALLRPGGQMAIFYLNMLWGLPPDHPDPRATLRPEGTPLGEALARAGLRYTARDFSAATYAHMQAKHRLGQAMRAEFAAEGRPWLADYILAESEAGDAPFDPDTTYLSRYLYHVVL